MAVSEKSAAAEVSTTALLGQAAGGNVEALAVQTTISPSSTRIPDISAADPLRQAVQASSDSDAMPPRRTLTVRNHSARPQSFVLLASPPAFAPLGVPDVVRHTVYQASLLVAADTGSHTFVIPVLGGNVDVAHTAAVAGPVYAVTGSARQKPDAGLPLFVSDFHILQEGDGVGPGERCLMTMPDGFEAAFSKARMPRDPDDDDIVANSKGMIGIEIDNSFGSNLSYPFVGLGAPNLYKPREIVPLVTWDAVPGNAYLVRPNLHTWIVARDTAERGTIYELSQSTRTQVVAFTTGDAAAEVIFEKNGTFTLVQDGG